MLRARLLIYSRGVRLRQRTSLVIKQGIPFQALFVFDDGLGMFASVAVQLRQRVRIISPDKVRHSPRRSRRLLQV